RSACVRAPITQGFATMPGTRMTQSRTDLPTGPSMPQNHTDVILGEDGASLHPVARACSVPRLRPGDLLPREGRVVARGEPDLRRVHGPHRVPELRPAPR